MVASFIPRRVRRVAGGAIALLAFAGLAAGCSTADGNVQAIAMFGSYTTQDVMGRIAALYNTDGTYNPDPDGVYGVPSHTSPETLDYTVPADGFTSCPTMTYSQGDRHGSSDLGRDHLSASVQATAVPMWLVRPASSAGVGRARSVRVWVRTRRRSSTTPTPSTRWE